MDNELKPVENEKLRNIISKLHEEYTLETEEEFFKELPNATFLAPVEIQIEGNLKDNITEEGTITLDKDTPINFMLISSEDGKNFFPAFTDEEELAKDEIKQHAIMLKLSNYAEMIEKNPSEVGGIVVNPFGEVVVVPKERIID